MKRAARIALSLMMAVLLIPLTGAAAPLESSESVPVTAPSVILAETATGTVIFEKNADEKREAASITKLMTALLTLEALEDGRVALND